MFEPHFKHDIEILARLVERSESTLTFLTEPFYAAGALRFVHPDLIGGQEYPETSQQVLAFRYHLLAEAFAHYVVHRTSYRSIAFLSGTPCIYPVCRFY